MAKAPRLLVKWESPGHAFLTSIKPAFSRVRGPRVPYIRAGIPMRGPVLSTLGHIALFWLLVALAPPEVKRPWQLVLLPVENEPTSIVYWSAGLPETADKAGAESGLEGKAGGGQFFSPDETIRISRGRKLTSAVVDAPTLKLSSDTKAVANLIVFAGTHSPVLEKQQPLAPEAPVRKPRPISPVVRAVAPPVFSREFDRNAQNPKLALPVVPQTPTEQPLLEQVANTPEPRPEATAEKGTDSSGPDALGLVLSPTPGTAVGLPADAQAGSFAVSPSGRAGGLSGQGNGGGIAVGQGPGSGQSGTGPGSGTSGAGYGSDASARGGTSLASGPGGAGEKNGTGRVQIPGLRIQGGVVNIPSFGSSTETGQPTRTPSDRRITHSVVIVATSRAGGALPAYGFLKGGRVYTIYIDTPNGTAVLQFSDPAAKQGFERELTPPEPLRTDIDTNAPLPRTIVACGIDRNGALKDLRVIEAVAPNIVPRLLAALNNWRFRPALRGHEAVEVTAILGFAINTR